MFENICEKLGRPIGGVFDFIELKFITLAVNVVIVAAQSTEIAHHRIASLLIRSDTVDRLQHFSFGPFGKAFTEIIISVIIIIVEFIVQQFIANFGKTTASAVAAVAAIALPKDYIFHISMRSNTYWRIEKTLIIGTGRIQSKAKRFNGHPIAVRTFGLFIPERPRIEFRR